MGATKGGGGELLVAAVGCRRWQQWGLAILVLLFIIPSLAENAICKPVKIGLLPAVSVDSVSLLLSPQFFL